MPVIRISFVNTDVLSKLLRVIMSWIENQWDWNIPPFNFWKKLPGKNFITYRFYKYLSGVLVALFPGLNALIEPIELTKRVLRSERDDEVFPIDPDQLNGCRHIRPRAKDDWVEVGMPVVDTISASIVSFPISLRNRPRLLANVARHKTKVAKNSTVPVKY